MHPPAPHMIGPRQDDWEQLMVQLALSQTMASVQARCSQLMTQDLAREQSILPEHVSPMQSTWQAYPLGHEHPLVQSRRQIPPLHPLMHATGHKPRSGSIGTVSGVGGFRSTNGGSRSYFSFRSSGSGPSTNRDARESERVQPGVDAIRARKHRRTKGTLCSRRLFGAGSTPLPEQLQVLALGVLGAVLGRQAGSLIRAVQLLEAAVQ